MSMQGILTLSEELLCEEEVLGMSFDISISSIDAKLYFPLCPEIDDKKPEIGIFNPLKAPLLASHIKRGSEKLIWGYPLQYPKCNSSVSLLALSVDCETEKNTEYAKIFYESISSWEMAFMDYIKIETKQGCFHDKNIQRNICNLELLADKYIPKTSSIELFLTIPREFASKVQIEEAIRYANSSKELFTEYKMLLNAYAARRINQNRLAIVNACSALEICLVRYLEDKCKELKLDKRLFLDIKFRSLGDRIRLAQTFDTGFPKNDYDKLVVKPRNDLVHNRETDPTDDVTNKLITCVEDYLGYYFKGKYY